MSFDPSCRPEVGQVGWLDQEVAEISLLVSGWQAAHLVSLASSQRRTVGQLLRRLICEYLAHQPARTESRIRTSDWDTLLETFVAELTTAAYAVALRHGTGPSWLELQLDMWKALNETVRNWGQGCPPEENPGPRPPGGTSASILVDEEPKL